jgi:hypothetical protein
MGIDVFLLYPVHILLCARGASDLPARKESPSLSGAQTKGLSLEQIDIMYQNTTPIKSQRYRRELVANDVHPQRPDVGGGGGVADKKGGESEEGSEKV